MYKPREFSHKIKEKLGLKKDDKDIKFVRK